MIDVEDCQQRTGEGNFNHQPPVDATFGDISGGQQEDQTCRQESPLGEQVCKQAVGGVKQLNQKIQKKESPAEKPQVCVGSDAARKRAKAHDEYR